MAMELPKRSEVKLEDTWNLADMYATDAAWEQDLSDIRTKAGELAAYEGKVAASAKNLLDVLVLEAEVSQKIELAFNYAQRLYDEDTGNNAHQAMAAKVMSLYAELGSQTAFIEPEILAIDEETLEAFYKEEAGLSLYRKQIAEIQRVKAHRLSAEMEKLLALTMEMSQTPSDTYGLLHNADMTFPETKDENGEMIRITDGRFVPLLESADRTVRKETFEKYYAEYKKLLNTYASLYNGQVKQQIFYAKARNYESTLVAAVDANNVSPVVYKNLVDTVDKNLDKLHRYVRLRKKYLGVDELHMYDIYTPMLPDASRKYTFEEAKEIVLSALAPLGEDYVAKVKEGFENRWIDVYENQGKRGGAYSAGAYGTHPYVLLNYNGSLDNVFTLAHEMGHAMHSYYSNENQPYIYSQYRIFVAEVASTCNEVLLLEYLLAHTDGEKERKSLLNHYLDMFKGTLFRQTQFAEYEMKTNQMVEEGESLNADNLSSLYKEINEKYYGPDMVSDDEIAYEWARIPHFYYDFYVYQYATSFSAAVAIAHDILRDGEPVVKRYKEFLSGGCSEAPVELLRKVGVDLESAEPIQAAIDVMAEVLDEMEK
jgi:oligoendopeptidase F